MDKFSTHFLFPLKMLWVGLKSTTNRLWINRHLIDDLKSQVIIIFISYSLRQLNECRKNVKKKKTKFIRKHKAHSFALAIIYERTRTTFLRGNKQRFLLEMNWERKRKKCAEKNRQQLNVVLKHFVASERGVCVRSFAMWSISVKQTLIPYRCWLIFVFFFIFSFNVVLWWMPNEENRKCKIAQRNWHILWFIWHWMALW